MTTFRPRNIPLPGRPTMRRYHGMNMVKAYKVRRRLLQQQYMRERAPPCTVAEVEFSLSLYRGILNDSAMTQYNALAQFKIKHGERIRYPMGIIGDIPGVTIGLIVRDRAELVLLGIHRQFQSGIDWMTVSHAGCQIRTAISVVVAPGEYEDDEDINAHTLIYTGAGGRDPDSRQQISDQEKTVGTAALEDSRIVGNLIRVVKKQEEGREMYIYAGLYKVQGMTYVPGQSQFKVHRFTLVKE